MNNFIKQITKNKPIFVITMLILLYATFSTGYLIIGIGLLDGIENVLRLLGSIVLVVIWLLLILWAIRTLLKKRIGKWFAFFIATLLLSTVFVIAAYNVTYIYGKLSKISNMQTTYSTSVVILSNSSKSDLNQITGKIGILSDDNSVDGHKIPKEVISNKKIKNEVASYDSYLSLIEALNEEEVEAIFLPTNYLVLFSGIETLTGLSETTKIIYTENKNVEVSRGGKASAITEPFTLLLMGVDSEKEDIKNSSFNGDALMLITFNPKTFNTTMMSIPRDTYVPIACFNGQRKNKITHAAWYGEKCMMDTIANFTGIDIDYFIKINFKGLVKVVDALGGVEIDVPYSFCEQDSNRSFGKNTVFVEKGLRTLNGEQALALSRNRKPNSEYCSSKWTEGVRNDFVRGTNQQLVIKGITSKLKEVRDLDMLYKLLDTISSNMETNMQTSEILSFYNIAKDMMNKSDKTDFLGMERLAISGYDQTIYDYSMKNNQGTRLPLYNFVPYKGSLSDVQKAMKINLGLEKMEAIKTFAFDINDPYEEMVIGKGIYNESKLDVLPNFVGQNKDKVIQYANGRGIKVNIESVTSNNASDFVGKVTNQKTPSGMDVEYVTAINIVVVEKVNVQTEGNSSNGSSANCALGENKDQASCAVPNFEGKTYSSFQTWKNKNNYSFKIEYEKISQTSEKYDKNKAGKVTAQSTSGKSIYVMIEDGITLKITYMEEYKEPGNDTGGNQSENNETTTPNVLLPNEAS